MQMRKSVHRHPLQQRTVSVEWCKRAWFLFRSSWMVLLSIAGDTRGITLQSAARLFASAAFALLAIEPTCASFMKESLTAQQQLRSRPKHASLLFPAQVFAARRAKVRMTEIGR